MTERKCFIFNFADVEVREREFLLRLSVEPKAFRVLLFLLRNPGRLVSKDEIVASVWNDTVVSDNSLTRSIAQLRRVLDDDPREPRYILTVPTLGYRFLSEVKAREDRFSVEVAAGAPSPDVGPVTEHEVVPARTKSRGGEARAIKSHGAGRSFSQPWPRPCCFSPLYSACDCSGAQAPHQARTRLIWQSNNDSPRIRTMFPCMRRRSRPMASISHTLTRLDSICARFPAVKRGAGACQRTLLYIPGAGTRTAHIS